MDLPEPLNPEDEIVQKLVLYPDRQWVLVLVRPRNEKAITREFLAQNIVAYLPLRTKVEKHNRSLRETQLPMFPGYVFASLTIDERYVVQKVSGVRYIKNLLKCQEPSLVADLLKVRQCELLSREHKLEVNPGLVPGRKVVIKNGPFKGQEVIIHKRKNALEVIVNLEFFEQNLEVTLSAEDLLLL